MPWTGTFTADEGSDDVGGVNLIWTSKDGLSTFLFPGRAKVGEKDTGGADVIIKEAIVARDAWLTRKAASDSGIAILLDKINTVDGAN